MGVSMIGKQRRTPTSASSSPHFVFPPGPLSPPGLSSGYGSLSASTHTLPGAETTGISRGIAHAPPPPPPAGQLAPLAKSQTSPQLGAGWAFRVLPRYGLQYPPVFTPDTYSLAQMTELQRADSPAAGERSFADSATQTEAGRPAPALAAPPADAGEAGGS
ncbi:protein transport protein SEC31-like [Pollicipes pollicipes]|uniref:protein transport protein SEC31-like n=1 Tax=Pollicipes pollicipes TaxID=41117 RepID=UPI001884E728|nr:protein transport protein SEC31-like [Pollicipes pollicipes]